MWHSLFWVRSNWIEKSIHRRESNRNFFHWIVSRYCWLYGCLLTRQAARCWMRQVDDWPAAVLLACVHHRSLRLLVSPRPWMYPCRACPAAEPPRAPLGGSHLRQTADFLSTTKNVKDRYRRGMGDEERSLGLLYFAWIVDDAKCIVVTRVCVSVCLSVCPRPHAHTTARTRM